MPVSPGHYAEGPEALVVSLAANGDRAAFAELVRRRQGWIRTFVVILVVFELLLSAPIQNSVGTMTQALSTSLIEVETGWLAVVVAPLNSVAGLIGVLLVGLHSLYRRRVR